ncbi:MAG: tetratricopeptide repeat protein [bacterium]
MSQGKGLSWKNYLLPTKTSRLEDFLKSNKGKKIWALFPSSTDEAAMNSVFWKAFKTQSEWISATIDFISRQKNLALIIRAHPNMGSDTSSGFNRDEINYFKQLKDGLPENVLLIESHERINTYEILRFAEAGLVFATTLSIEMACRGLPVVAAGNPGWSNCPLVASVESREDYLKKLAALHDSKPTGTKLLELVRGAYRLAHAYYFKSSIKFPFLKQLNYFIHVLDSRSAQDFQPGKQPELDRVVESILGESAIVPEPARLVDPGQEMEEQAALERSLAFFRHPEFVSDAPELSIVLHSPSQVQDLVKRTTELSSDFLRMIELVVCQFENSISREDASRLSKDLSGIKVTNLQTTSGRAADMCNQGIRQSRGHFLMVPGPSVSIDWDMIEKFLGFPKLEKDTIFYGNLRHESPAGVHSVRPPAHITARILSQCNPLPTASIFSREIWEAVGGFRGDWHEGVHWSFWLASALSGKKFHYIDGLAEGVGTEPNYSTPLPPQVVIDNASAFPLGDIERARASLRYSHIGQNLTQAFTNSLDLKLAELKRLKESGKNLPWQTSELVSLISPLFKLRCHELALDVLEEILAREPGNPSILKVYADLLPHCGRKQEAQDVLRQISTGSKIPMPEITLIHDRKEKIEPASHPSPAQAEDEDVFFGREEVENIKSLVHGMSEKATDEEGVSALRKLRMGLGEHLLGAEEADLPGLFDKDYGEVFWTISESALAGLERLPDEDKIAQATRSYLEALGAKIPDPRFLLLAMLFFRPESIDCWPSTFSVPAWLRDHYAQFLNQSSEHAGKYATREARPSETRLPVLGSPANDGGVTRDSTSIKILFLTASPRQYMAPPELGGFQINAGPEWEDAKDSTGRWKSFKTPAGRYAVDSILGQIPADEQPDVLVCLVDASCINMPAGLSAFRGPKVLLLADTHHLDSPLTGMMAYALSEPYDRIAFLYDRHHIPFFAAAGLKNLFWLPGFTFPHADQIFTKVSNETRNNAVGFVGRAGAFHPRRQKLLQKIQSTNIPFLHKVIPQDQSIEFYASCSVGFNASLNGDLNLRFFEILASGAALVTDALGLESGLDLLAQSGCKFETFASPDELIEKLNDLLNDPSSTAEIGKAGRDWFLRNLNLENRRKIFQKMVFDGIAPDIFKIPSPPCFQVSFSEKQLLPSIQVYEFIQELHRNQEQVTILKAPGIEHMDFFKTLPRLQIRDADEGGHGDMLVANDDAWASANAVDCKHLWMTNALSEPSWLRERGYVRLPGRAALFERRFNLMDGISATIEVAVSAFHSGRLTQAEDVCRAILQRDEKCAGAWHLMGRMAALQSDLEAASEFASAACDLDPQNADFLRDLAEVCFQKRELDSAEQYAQRALEMAPDSPEGLVLLGRILVEKDDKSAALEFFQEALRIRKDYAEGFSHYALALQKFGRGKDAISQIRKACALEPESVEFQTNLAILLEQNARYVDALAAYGKAARMNPSVGFVWFRQGKLLNGLKRYAESITALEKATSLPGQLGDYHYEYGLALHMSKRFQEALGHYEKALAMGYNTAALQCNRGVIYKDLRKGGDAIVAFHAAVIMEPANVSYLNNLGAAALELGLNSEALECFEQAVEKNPKLPTARNNIGNLLKDRARGMDALPHYRKSMELNPDDRDAPSNYLLCHMYIPDMDPKGVFEEHKSWGIATAKKFPPAFKFKPRATHAKIRVGFVSADFCHHPVAYFIAPILRGYDRERFEFVAYGDQRKNDEFSTRFASQVDLWRATSSYDDRALAKLIFEDHLDILFELAGHTAFNRLGVFSMKPAPIQVSYLGYPGTTGLPAMDFRITDALADPLGLTEHLHTEKLIRVPECAWCFEPDAAAPDVQPLPALRNGYVTFGCFNNMAKLNPSLFETWSEILLRVPGSHLRLKARTLTDIGVRKELMAYFTARGIEEHRLDFFGHTQKIVDHLGHYNSVDIALDSFPYHGTTTTCEAMWMGCPVITRAGKTHVSRVGVSLLNAVVLQEFIAESREAYIETAVDLAAQTARLQEMRSGMRERLKTSALMDEKRFVAGFESTLLEIARLSGLKEREQPA